MHLTYYVQLFLFAICSLYPIPCRVYLANHAYFGCNLNKQSSLCFASIPVAQVSNTDLGTSLTLFNVRINAGLGSYLVLNLKQCENLGLKRISGHLQVAGLREQCTMYDDAKITILDAREQGITLQCHIRVICSNGTITQRPTMGLGALTNLMDLYVDGEEVYSMLDSLEEANVKVTRSV